jgi:hypothetical protein
MKNKKWVRVSLLIFVGLILGVPFSGAIGLLGKVMIIFGIIEIFRKQKVTQ